MSALRRFLNWLFGSAEQPASGLREELEFSENLTVGSGATPATNRSPPRGALAFEARSEDGELLHFEVLSVERCAPAGSASGWTRCVVPHGAEQRAHQYRAFDVPPPGAELPSELKPKLAELRSAKTLRIWWSCHA